MIIYTKNSFGLNLIFRIHGSAVYRAVFPALVAVGVYFLLERYWLVSAEGDLLHPYAVGLAISGITFLIIFRLTQSYGRYWEATGEVFKMMSKWVDAAVHCADYHLQSSQYDHIKPPSYRDYPNLNSQFLTRDRERQLPDPDSRQYQSPKKGKISSRRAVLKSINTIDHPRHSNEEKKRDENPTKDEDKDVKVESASSSDSFIGSSGRRKKHSENLKSERVSSRHFESAAATASNEFATTPGLPRFLTGQSRMDGNWGPLFDDGKSTFLEPSGSAAFGSFKLDPKGFASTRGGRTPPLFLQELAHLTSLLSAVAFSTLRNDVEGAESPLGVYEVGSPWPAVDPADDEYLYDSKAEMYWNSLLYFMGKGRLPEVRTRYNAARPLPVLGGVSEAEIRMLQMARGPLAKTQLCWSWLSEFVTREHLAGSMGNVGAPILSRVKQFISDGMSSYNQARKIMFVPFPFAHAQLSSVFVNLMMLLIPILMDQYTNENALGAFLVFASVLCLSGIHEVARELENPFRNIPNELPVVTLQAQLNEALITMYAGYHPDFFWDQPTKNESALIDDVPGPHLRSKKFSPGFPEMIMEEPNMEEPSMEETIVAIGTSGTSVATNGSSAERPPGEFAAVLTPDHVKEKKEVDQLRTIVEQQGQLMEQMLKEQSRLNKMVHEILASKS